MAHPLPKTAELNNIEDLRPICLLEIFRKLWTSILTYRIRTTWEVHDILAPPNMDSAPTMVPTAPPFFWLTH